MHSFFFVFRHLFSVVYEACLFVDGSGLEYVQFVVVILLQCLNIKFPLFHSVKVYIMA